MSTDHFLRAERTAKYRCHEFVRDVWLQLVGTDIELVLPTLFESDRHIVHTELRKLSRIRELVDPCIVCVTQFRRDPHVGVYTDGSVLHLGARVAVRCSLDQFTRYGTDVRFYR